MGDWLWGGRGRPYTLMWNKPFSDRLYDDLLHASIENHPKFTLNFMLSNNTITITVLAVKN